MRPPSTVKEVSRALLRSDWCRTFFIERRHAFYRSFAGDRSLKVRWSVSVFCAKNAPAFERDEECLIGSGKDLPSAFSETLAKYEKYRAEGQPGGVPFQV